MPKFRQICENSAMLWLCEFVERLQCVGLPLAILRRNIFDCVLYASSSEWYCGRENIRKAIYCYPSLSTLRAHCYAIFVGEEKVKCQNTLSELNGWTRVLMCVCLSCGERIPKLDHFTTTSPNNQIRIPLMWHLCIISTKNTFFFHSSHHHHLHHCTGPTENRNQIFFFSQRETHTSLSQQKRMLRLC